MSSTTDVYPFRDAIIAKKSPSPINKNIVVEIPSPRKTFWDLPSEIRVQIYDEIWATKRPFELKLPTKSDQSRSDRGTLIARVQYSLDGPLANPGGASSSRFRRLPWFLTNKRMCQEAINQFQRHATWKLLHAYTEDWSHMIPDGPQFTVWRNPVSRGRSTRLGPYLLTPSTAQNVILNGGIILHTFGEIDNQGQPVNRVTWGYASDLLQRLGSSLACSKNLRSLKLTVFADVPGVEAAVKGPKAPRTVVDFKWLQGLELPQLQKFQLTVHFDQVFAADASRRSEFDKTVGEVGMDLIGGSGVQTTKTFYTVLLGIVYTFKRVAKYPKEKVASA